MSTQPNDNDRGVEISFLNKSICINIDPEENTIPILCYTRSAFGVICGDPKFHMIFFSLNFNLPKMTRILVTSHVW
jgi:hypothetical protein